MLFTDRDKGRGRGGGLEEADEEGDDWIQAVSRPQGGIGGTLTLNSGRGVIGRERTAMDSLSFSSSGSGSGTGRKKARLGGGGGGGGVRGSSGRRYWLC